MTRYYISALLVERGKSLSQFSVSPPLKTWALQGDVARPSYANSLLLRSVIVAVLAAVSNSTYFTIAYYLKYRVFIIACGVNSD